MEKLKKQFDESEFLLRKSTCIRVHYNNSCKSGFYKNESLMRKESILEQSYYELPKSRWRKRQKSE